MTAKFAAASGEKITPCQSFSEGRQARGPGYQSPIDTAKNRNAHIRNPGLCNQNKVADGREFCPL